MKSRTPFTSVLTLALITFGAMLMTGGCSHDAGLSGSTDANPNAEHSAAATGKRSINIVTDDNSCSFDRSSMDVIGKDVIQFHNKTNDEIVISFDDISLFGLESYTIVPKSKEELVVQEGEPVEVRCTLECDASLTSSADTETETESETTSTSTEQTATETELYSYAADDTAEEPEIIINRR